MSNKQQEIIEKVKAEAAAKKKPDAPEDDKDPDEALKELEDKAAANEKQLELNATQQKIMDQRRAAAMRDDTQANTDDEDVEGEQRANTNDESFNTARRKLERIARDYLPSTPDEYVIFGRGGIQFTLGDLRALFPTR